MRVPWYLGSMILTVAVFSGCGPSSPPGTPVAPSSGVPQPHVETPVPPDTNPPQVGQGEDFKATLPVIGYTGSSGSYSSGWNSVGGGGGSSGSSSGFSTSTSENHSGSGSSGSSTSGGASGGSTGSGSPGSGNGGGIVGGPASDPGPVDGPGWDGTGNPWGPGNPWGTGNPWGPTDPWNGVAPNVPQPQSAVPVPSSDRVKQTASSSAAYVAGEVHDAYTDAATP